MHGLPDAMEAHAIVKESVDDGVANAVGVLGSWFDPFDLGAEGLAAVAGGAVFSECQFDDDDLCVADVANTSRVGTLPPSGRAAVGTREGLGSTTLPENANASGVHACVLDGMVW
jgi:hypothetical protein